MKEGETIFRLEPAKIESSAAAIAMVELLCQAPVFRFGERRYNVSLSTLC
jgi:hypothetical protein